MPTNLTDRLGELIGCAESGAASDRSQLAHFVLNHKDEILSALRKAEEIERLTAREAELCEVLRPFVEWGASLADHLPDDFQISIKDPGTQLINMGHLRRLIARLSLGDEK